MGTAEREKVGELKGLLSVSIRCREMGTAEHIDEGSGGDFVAFLFAVARWGQRNSVYRCDGG